MGYKALFARSFHDELMGLSSYDQNRIETSIDILLENPRLAREYEPYYPSSKPPFDLRCYYVPRTHKLLFLTIGETDKTLRFYFIADTRMDPLHRFE